MNYGIIYRSCDRPKYVEKTLPILLNNTSCKPSGILLFDNSTDDGRRDQVLDVAKEYDTKSNFITHFSEKPRIGGTQVIIEGVKLLRERFNLDAIMVVDDDVAVPRKVAVNDKEIVYWDSVLADMLEAGWNVVAHPWATDFRKNTIKEYGGVKGHEISGVGGGCSGFRLDFYDKNPMEQQTLIRGYNEWMVRWTQGVKCGYSHEHDMLIEHIDRPEHPWSLRDTEYDEWATAMYWERFTSKRGQERPKGSKGIW